MSGAEQDRTPGRTDPSVDEQVVYRVDDHDQGTSLERGGLDVPATIGGALAALGALVVLSSLVGAIVGSIGFQSGVDDADLSVGGLVAGGVVLLVACLVGGWVAGRLAGRRGGLHGLLAIGWLVLLAVVVALLAAAFGDSLDVRGEIGLPRWFDRDARTTEAVISGVIALGLMLLAGWLGGRRGDRGGRHRSVALVRTRRGVREHPGGISADRGI